MFSTWVLPSQRRPWCHTAGVFRVNKGNQLMWKKNCDSFPDKWNKWKKKRSIMGKTDGNIRDHEGRENCREPLFNGLLWDGTQGISFLFAGSLLIQTYIITHGYWQIMVTWCDNDHMILMPTEWNCMWSTTTIQIFCCCCCCKGVLKSHRQIYQPQLIK